MSVICRNFATLGDLCADVSGISRALSNCVLMVEGSIRHKSKAAAVSVMALRRTVTKASGLLIIATLQRIG